MTVYGVEFLNGLVIDVEVASRKTALEVAQESAHKAVEETCSHVAVRQGGQSAQAQAAPCQAR